MQAPTRKQLPRRLGILQILLRADIAKEDDLADLLEAQPLFYSKRNGELLLLR